MLERTKKEAQGQNFMNLGPQMANISVDNQRDSFNTGTYGDWDPTPQKKVSKIGLIHVFSWPKLGVVAKCHDHRSFGGFGKR